jgi:hypothetical protein
VTELAQQPRDVILDPGTGELVPAEPEPAARLLVRLRSYYQPLRDAVKACEAVLVAESQRLGTKTLTIGDNDLEVYGGKEIAWDVEQLRATLTAAGCPEDRITALIRETVEYRIDARVAKQLAGSNPVYAELIDAARTEHETAPRVRVKA